MNSNRQIFNDEQPGYAGVNERTPRRPIEGQVATWRQAPTWKHQEHGFTLIELLVVMLIIVILSGITIAVTKYVTLRARKAQTEIELQKIRVALDEYRAVYGEYPIVGDAAHYPERYATDPDTISNLPAAFRYVDLVHTAATPIDVQSQGPNINPYNMPGVEYLPFRTPVRVDYRLVYALKLRPESEGRPPFMEFPKVTVCSLVWRTVDASHEGQFSVYDVRGVKVATKLYMRGDPINRYLAVNPFGYQWHYECSNGTTYTLTNWGW